MDNGSAIYIWGMPWLANSGNPFIEMLGDSELEEVTIDALMKPGFVE